VDNQQALELLHRYHDATNAGATGFTNSATADALGLSSRRISRRFCPTTAVMRKMPVAFAFDRKDSTSRSDTRLLPCGISSRPTGTSFITRSSWR
jgi:hypothetical protein